ncbi:hypothetical protein, partial [Acinetobacter johnsonii]|uniref:hypothetical protein n=1 Tax=Acinetobacter johnsonii TaxID=40214 RepID=UPI001F3806BB
QKPTVADTQNLGEWKGCVTKARRIIFEGARDYIVSNIHGKEPMYAMYRELIDFFQNSSEHRKLSLKDKL